MMAEIKRKLIVFSKAPIAGQVKTRLIPALGESGACYLHTQALRHCIKTVCESGLASVDLFCAPDIQDAEFQRLKQNYPLRLLPQVGNNLGERMFNAIQFCLKENQQVILIGTDCPNLSATDFKHAFAALNHEKPIAIAPATDGGYVLIAASSIEKAVFDHIQWSTASVYAQTCNNLSKLGWQYSELKRHFDLDEAEDLTLLSPQQRLQFLPHKNNQEQSK